MRNRIFILLLNIFFIWNCSTAEKTTLITSSDMEMVLQEFTEARINQYLYLNEHPKDNMTIIVMVLNRHNMSYSNFIEALKTGKPSIYHKLFGHV